MRLLFSLPRPCARLCFSLAVVAGIVPLDARSLVTVSTIAGRPQFGFADGTGREVGFANPLGLATDVAGNIYVAAAKRMLRGTVGTDAEAGPTEVAIIADHTADPEFVAADLIAQAEHDPLAACLLITTDPGLADPIDAVMYADPSDVPTLNTAALLRRSAARANKMLVGDTDYQRLDRYRAIARKIAIGVGLVLAALLLWALRALVRFVVLAIRNRGTVGGSLAHADPAAEWPALAVLLEATLLVRSQMRPSRLVPAEDFFAADLRVVAMRLYSCGCCYPSMGTVMMTRT